MNASTIAKQHTVASSYEIVRRWPIIIQTRLLQVSLCIFSSTGQFTKLVEFCYSTDNGNGDRLRQGVNDCSNAYRVNYGVYGGTSDTENSIIIYNYVTIAGPVVSNLFLDDEDNFAIYRENSRNGLNFMVYIPGIVNCRLYCTHSESACLSN